MIRCRDCKYCYNLTSGDCGCRSEEVEDGYDPDCTWDCDSYVAKKRGPKLGKVNCTKCRNFRMSVTMLEAVCYNDHFDTESDETHIDNLELIRHCDDYDPIPDKVVCYSCRYWRVCGDGFPSCIRDDIAGSCVSKCREFRRIECNATLTQPLRGNGHG